MSGKGPGRVSLALLVCMVALLTAQPVLACSVCYGDPNSAMSHGARAGVLVLLGVVGVVLLGLASMMIFWMRRAAKLESQGGAVEEPHGVYATGAHHQRSGT